MKFFVAGGAVRDLLLGRPVRDVDYVFAATEEEFIQRNPSARKIQSGACRIYLHNGQEFAPLLHGDIAQDLLRRDFTINALLLTQEGVLHAHPQAFADLREGLIRPASGSALADDPVRVFRAARLSASLPRFSLHEDCVRQMRVLRPHDTEPSFSQDRRDPLAAIAAEQVGREVYKACLSARPGNFLRSLALGNCLTPWFQEFAQADSIPAGPPAWHKISVLEHSAAVMDKTAAIASEQQANDAERALAVWMAFCHDVGKTATPTDVLPHHYGHEMRGAAMAEALALRLRLPAVFAKAGKLASLLHMKAGQYAHLRPGSKTDMLMQLHMAGVFAPFCWAAAADAATVELPRMMQADRDRIVSVSLPEKWRNKGELSGRRLRELRCMALCASHAT